MMTKEQQAAQKLGEIQELARGRGVGLFTMEEIACTAAKALVGGAMETMTCQQAATKEISRCFRPAQLQRVAQAFQMELRRAFGRRGVDAALVLLARDVV